MKTFPKFLLLLAATALFAAGCVNEDPAYLNEEEPTVPAVTHGYLAATALSMRVIADTQTDTGDDDTGGETARPSSRTEAAESIDTDPFLVEITDAAGGSVLKTTYGELKTQLAEPMPLSVGSYTLTVRSEEMVPAAEWEHPVYGASKTFSVSKANTKENPVQIGEVVCTLQNIKVTVKLSKDLVDKLTADSQATVSLGANSLVFPLTGGKAGYFLPQEATNTLDFVLSGKFADTQEPVQFSKTISGVKAGQWRRITLVIAYADKGGIHLDIQVDSFIQDETVVVDGTQGAWEDLYEDNPVFDPPTIVWKGNYVDGTPYDIDRTEPYELDERMQIDIEFTAQAGIKSLVVTIISRTLDVTEVGLPQTFDLADIRDPALATTLGAPDPDGFGFPINEKVKDQTSVPFCITPFVELLPMFEGVHEFKLDLTDNQNETVTKSVKIHVTPTE